MVFPYAMLDSTDVVLFESVIEVSTICRTVYDHNPLNTTVETTEVDPSPVTVCPRTCLLPSILVLVEWDYLKVFEGRPVVLIRNNHYGRCYVQEREMSCTVIYYIVTEVEFYVIDE